MKIVIAPDSFKGSLSAELVTQAIAAGFSSVFPQATYVKIPVADGGEGTTKALLGCTDGTLHWAPVLDPIGRQTIADFALLQDGTAVIELAAASGLTLVEQHMQNPLLANTYGTGQLICTALNLGAKAIILGLGGSGTNDGGIGLSQALGIRFLAQDGTVLTQIGQMAQLNTIDPRGLDKRLFQVPITLATDVKNPLCGKTGATAIYGGQKGVSGDLFGKLDAILAHISQCMPVDYSNLSGIGAAGGAGLPLVAFCGATIKSGIDVVLDLANFDSHLQNADLVITGEGRMDGQSIYGKVPIGVAARAKKQHLPVIAIVGGLGDGADQVYNYGIDAVFPIPSGPMSLSLAMEQAENLIYETARRVARTIALGQKIK